MARAYNFAAGPGQLPETVLEQARDELVNWHDTQMSVMEMPHRGEIFKKIASESTQDLREILNIPANYKILFLSGGARTQFSMIPMNLAEKSVMAYVDTGAWSGYAIKEAKIYGEVEVVASGANHQYIDIPDYSSWNIPKNAAYLHYTDNETIHGVEFSAPPEAKNIPLIADMSSNLLSRPVDMNRFGLIYACAQKNIGPAGITVVIIRDDLLAREPFAFTPTMLRYTTHSTTDSLYNTPPTFCWYMAGLVFKWVKAQGGLEVLAKINQRKAEKLYNLLDHSDFYINSVKKPFRSRMSVIFNLADEKLNSTFLQESEKNGLLNLKGHKTKGGMRASLYNAMPEKGVDALISFMQDFEKRYA